jgi:hypothetical protein
MKKIMLIISLLSVLAITNAQVNENKILDTNFVQKNELKMTPEITEMVVTEVSSRFINRDDKYLSNYGVTSRSQLTNLHLGKPIPEYVIENESLKFIGKWQVLVMSDSEPLFIANIKLEDDGQYRYAGKGSASKAERIHNYEHKNLIMGILHSPVSRMEYLYIRKDNKDIFVESYDWVTREFFKNEYSLSELINLIKE